MDETFVEGLSDVRMVGRYEIIEKIGQGATGWVYLGLDPYIKRNVAIKISRPTNEGLRERFFVEAQSAGRLAHPNVVAIYDVGVYGDFCYLTMEYVDGSTLEKYCKPDNLFTVEKAVEITISICQALDFGHEQGVIHRDIKPSNILVDQATIPKITDFGTAQMLEQTSEMGVWGTPSYCSPEQLQEEAIGGYSDVFSAGCVLYELLCGQKAFDGNNNYATMHKILNEEPLPIRQVRPELPEVFEKIISKAILKSPDKRYQSALDMAYDLRVALRSISSHNRFGKVQDAIDYIHRVPFFRNFTREQVAELSASSDIVKYDTGHVMVEEGEIDDSFYIILSGKVEITRQGNRIAIIGAGECFGEMAFIGCQARVATVKAHTECLLMKISATLFERSPQSVQLLFFKNFSMTLVNRLSTRYRKP